MATPSVSLEKKVYRNAFYSGAYHLWYLGTRLLITPLVLTYVSLEEYGLWAYCFVLLGYIGLAANGFSGAYLKYGAHHRATGNNQGINVLLSTGVITLLALSLILAPLLYWTLPYFLHWLITDPSLLESGWTLLLGAGIIFIINFTLSGFQNILEGDQRTDLVRKIHFAASILELALMVALLQMGLGVMALLIAYGARFVLILCLNIFWAYRLFPFLSLRFSLFSRKVLKQFFVFGGQIQLIGVITLLMHSLDRLVLSKVLGMEAVGMYEVGRKLPNTGMALPSSMAGVLMPAAANLQSRNEPDRIKKLYLHATRYLMMISVLPYLFLMFYSPQIISVWLGGDFAVSANVMQVLALGILVNLTTGIGTACVRGLGQPIMEIRYLLVSLAIFALTLFPAISKLGMVGVAYAFTIAQTIGSIVFLIQANQSFQVTGREFFSFVIKPLAIAFFAFLPVCFLGHWVWAVYVPGRAMGLIILAALFCASLLAVGGTLWFGKEYFLLKNEVLRVRAWLATIQIFPSKNKQWTAT